MMNHVSMNEHDDDAQTMLNYYDSNDLFHLYHHDYRTRERERVIIKVKKNRIINEKYSNTEMKKNNVDLQ